MMKRAVLGCWPVLVALACGDPPVSSQLTVSAQVAGGELTVDDACVPFCGGGDSVDVAVSYAAPKSGQQGSVQFVQYRVDYTLPGVTGVVPFFAGYAAFSLAPGKNQTQALLVVGSAQRAFVQQATSGQAVTGTAKVTLAGYDFDNRQVFVDATFNVVFRADSSLGAPVDAGGGNAG